MILESVAAVSTGGRKNNLSRNLSEPSKPVSRAELTNAIQFCKCIDTHFICKITAVLNCRRSKTFGRKSRG